MLNEKEREIVVNTGKTDVQERGGLVGWMHCKRNLIKHSVGVGL